MHEHRHGRLASRIVTDLGRERLAEMALVAIAAQVELERLRLDAEIARPVLDRRDVLVRAARLRAHGSQLVARHLHVRDARVGKRLQPRVVLGAR
jgi:hypothetical protein